MIFFDLALYLIILLLIFVKTKKQASVLFWFACLVCILLQVILIRNILLNLNVECWDYFAYFYSSDVFSKGINPYLQSEVEQALDFGFTPFRYFPISLYFFRIFNHWEYNLSLEIYIVLKSIIFLLTISIWLIYVFKDYRLKTFLVLIATYGFNKATFIDFDSGNITVFEVFGLTIAVIFLLKNKTIMYCLIIAFLALFKVQVIALIFLPLINFKWRRVYIILSIILMCTILFFTYYYLNPPLIQAYIDLIFTVIGDTGKYAGNFGIMHLINTFVSPFLKNIIDFTYWNYLIYFLWITLIGVLTFFAFRKTKGKVSNMMLITYSIFVFALIVPRFPDYTFMFLIVPAVYVIHYCFSNKVLQSAICLLICSSLGFTAYRTPLHYQPFILVFVLFVMYLLFFYRISTGKISQIHQNVTSKIL